MKWKFDFVSIYSTPPHEQDVTQGQFFKQNLTEFEFRVVLLLDWLPYSGKGA